MEISPEEFIEEILIQYSHQDISTKIHYLYHSPQFDEHVLEFCNDVASFYKIKNYINELNSLEDILNYYSDVRSILLEAFSNTFNYQLVKYIIDSLSAIQARGLLTYLSQVSHSDDYKEDIIDYQIQKGISPENLKYSDFVQIKYKYLKTMDHFIEDFNLFVEKEHTEIKEILYLEDLLLWLPHYKKILINKPLSDT